MVIYAGVNAFRVRDRPDDQPSPAIPFAAYYDPDAPATAVHGVPGR